MQDNINDQQINDLRQAFSVFDKDNNGSISIEELGNVMKSIGMSPSQSTLNEMFKMIDVDESGTINFNEFLDLMYGRSHNKDPDSNLRSVFKVFDKDNNGYITPDELKQAMESLNEHVTDEDIEGMIKEADLNNDGKVNYEEFIKMMKSNK